MRERSFLFAKEPVWHANRPGLPQQLPSAARSWIYEAGSLTQRLRSFYGDSVKVKVLHQHYSKPFFSENRLLGLAPQTRQLVREVMLIAGNVPLILARTVIPDSTMMVAANTLSSLGDRPLGEVIFAYPDLARQQLDLCSVKPLSWTAQAGQLANIENKVLGRRTCYLIARQQPLLVSEFFLPGALALG
ncbi:MAG: chorismate--pyruvate lyase [Methylobacter sp.]|nr:MAG: chorismate--pyruvate lyase [Methylobacter sp.]